MIVIRDFLLGRLGHIGRVQFHLLPVLRGRDFPRKRPVGVGRLLRCLPVAEVVVALGVVLFRDLVLFYQRYVLQSTTGSERVRVEVRDVDRPPIVRGEVAQFDVVIDHVRNDLPRQATESAHTSLR